MPSTATKGTSQKTASGVKVVEGSRLVGLKLPAKAKSRARSRVANSKRPAAVPIYVVTCGRKLVLATHEATVANAYVKSFNKSCAEGSPKATLDTFQYSAGRGVATSKVDIPTFIVRSHSGDVLTVTESQDKADIYRSAYDQFNAKSGYKARIDQGTSTVPKM